MNLKQNKYKEKHAQSNHWELNANIKVSVN